MLPVTESEATTKIYIQLGLTLIMDRGGRVLFGLVHFCLDVRTLAFCQLMGFPLNH